MGAFFDLIEVIRIGQQRQGTIPKSLFEAFVPSQNLGVEDFVPDLRRHLYHRSDGDGVVNMGT